MFVKDIQGRTHSHFRPLVFFPSRLYKTTKQTFSLRVRKQGTTFIITQPKSVGRVAPLCKHKKQKNKSVSHGKLVVRRPQKCPRWTGTSTGAEVEAAVNGGRCGRSEVAAGEKLETGVQMQTYERPLVAGRF